ncbi:hypothetical protein EPUS_08848 [Endocarpon pusillum Z07020]|uniref:CHAT domain-containing protein n=1 Tax=Endocarpon pusillum (strain Z07020 / HMAS-L-300199) TaxID=1263415 RepID=U1GM56_ENDPU|nr:uncharacterized protein EPUS_08848 [Endocarpon pusillum Z07020]ERF72991.1 hypothetical protein EPUS_08848 [Endocarpon pusillum Z07020]
MAKQVNGGENLLALSPDDQAFEFALRYQDISGQYEQNGDPADLDEAIKQIEQAVDIGKGHVHTAGYLNNLGRILRLRFERTFQDEDIRRAVDASRRCLAVMIPQSTHKPLFLANVSDTLAVRFFQKGLYGDLEESLQLARDAVEASSAIGQYRGPALEALASRLNELHLYDGGIQSLSDAISIGRTLVDEITEDETAHAVYLNNHACGLSSRHSMLNHIEDLEAAIWHTQKAIEKLPAGHIMRVRISANLNRYLHRRALQTKSLADLDQGIDGNEKLLRDIPFDHPQRPIIMISLASALRDRYRQTGSLEHFNRAISLVEQATAIKQMLPNFRATALLIQSELLEIRNEPGDLATALTLNRKALKIPVGCLMDRINILVGLSNRLGTVFSSTGLLSDIEEAISLAQEAVDLVPPSHPGRPGWLHNIAQHLRSKAEVAEPAECLGKAIDLERQAIGSVGIDHVDLHFLLGGLSSCLSARYRMTGTTGDLEEAIHAGRGAVAATKKGSTDHLAYLNNLCNRLVTRYDESKNPADIEDAIAAISEALTVSPNDAVYVSTLGNALFRRYEVAGDKKDLDESICYAKKAIQLHPRTDVRGIGCLHNLGLRLAFKFTLSSKKDFEALESALRIAQECVDATPTGHPALSGYLYQLGLCLTHQVQRDISIDRLEEAVRAYDMALSAFQRSFSAAGATPRARIRAGKALAAGLLGNKNWAEAYQVLKVTVELFQKVSSRSLAGEDQQRMLSGFSGISAWAASAALYAGLGPAPALETLEAGRGIISSLAMNARNDVTDLASVHPGLASEYEQARAAIASAGLNSEDIGEAGLKAHMCDLAKLQQQKVARLEQVEADIRLLEGFERFQLPPTSGHLVDLAKHGPLVCFNVTCYRSDAFMVTSYGIQSINLPDLQLATLEANVQRIMGPDRLSKSSILERSKSNKDMRLILCWLWEVAVQPVLHKLELLAPDGVSQLPRLWWVTSGYMGLMPLHAAGDYEKENSKDCTAHYVVSSYISNFKALVYARNREGKGRHLDTKHLLVVSMPTTPDVRWKPLNVAGEIAAIERSHRGTQRTQIELTLPSARDVLERLRSHNIVHFACHGDPDAENPSESSLILCRDPGAIDRLTVKQVSEITNTEAQLAYLSACSTAQHYSSGLMDEAIHMASAFQLIGYPSVVGTLWEADDSASAKVAEAFYEQLAIVGDHVKTSDIAARALHFATLTIRDRRRGRVRRPDHDAIGWAPFIHIGA